MAAGVCQAPSNRAACLRLLTKAIHMQLLLSIKSVHTLLLMPPVVDSQMLYTSHVCADALVGYRKTFTKHPTTYLCKGNGHGNSDLPEASVPTAACRVPG